MGSKTNHTCLVDSNLWIGFYKEDDTLHKDSVALLNTLEAKQTKTFVTNLIVQEVFTILWARASHSSAYEFWKMISNNSNIQLINLDDYWLGETIKLMEEGALTKKMSLVDYTNIYISLVFGFQLLTFDKQLQTTFTQAQKAFS